MIDTTIEEMAALQWGVLIGASLAAASFDLRTRKNLPDGVLTCPAV